MKPGGKDGKLYKIHEEAEISGGPSAALEKSGFYRIRRVGEDTALPRPGGEDLAKGARAMGPGDVVHLWAGPILNMTKVIYFLKIKNLQTV